MYKELNELFIKAPDKGHRYYLKPGQNEKCSEHPLVYFLKPVMSSAPALDSLNLYGNFERAQKHSLRRPLIMKND